MYPGSCVVRSAILCQAFVFRFLGTGFVFSSFCSVGFLIWWHSARSLIMFRALVCLVFGGLSEGVCVFSLGRLPFFVCSLGVSCG